MQITQIKVFMPMGHTHTHPGSQGRRMRNALKTTHFFTFLRGEHLTAKEKGINLICIQGKYN